MAFVHGKGSVFKLNSVDLSAYMNSIEFDRGADSHDVTTYGDDAHQFAGGLGTGSIAIGGYYDSGASGPALTIEPLIGTVTTFDYQPEGTGTGKPTRTGSALVAGYKESDPVAGMISWTAALTVSGAVTDGSQS